MKPGNMNLQTTVRELEDVRDARTRLKVESVMLQSDYEYLDELGTNEIKHGIHYKRRLQELEDLCEKEANSMNRAADTRLDLKNASMARVLEMSNAHLKRSKELAKANKAELEKVFQGALENHARSHPLVMECYGKENEINRIERYLVQLVEVEKGFEKKMKDKRALAGVLYKESIIDMASHVLRYYTIVGEHKNPHKKTNKASPGKSMAYKATHLSKSTEPAESAPDSCSEKIDRQIFPETSSTSKRQETVDANEVGATQAFHGDPVSRSEMQLKRSEEIKSQRVGAKKSELNQRQRNESVTKEPPNSPNVSVAKFSIKKIATDENAAKVNVKAGIKRQRDESVTKEPPKKPNVSNSQSILKKTARDENAVNGGSKQFGPSSSSLKFGTEATSSSQSQKSKRVQISFGRSTNVGLQLSDNDFDMDLTRNKEVSSSGFNVPAANDIVLEMPSDDENPKSVNNGEFTAMNNFDRINDEINILTDDEYPDNISNWTSLDVPSGNNAEIISCPRFDGDIHSMVSQNSNNDSEPMNNFFGDFNLNNDDMGLFD